MADSAKHLVFSTSRGKATTSESSWYWWFLSLAHLPTVGVKRTSGQYWHKCAVPTTWTVIHKWKMLAKHTSRGNAASDYNTQTWELLALAWIQELCDALFDIRLLHRLCHAPLLHCANLAIFHISLHTNTTHVLRFSQYPLSISIYIVYHRHLSIKFLPLKLSTKQCTADIKNYRNKNKNV
jgi:hypothetical protein